MTVTQSNKPPVKAGLLDRLKSGLVICAEGYLFELERRGYLQAGAFVPEAVVEAASLKRPPSTATLELKSRWRFSRIAWPVISAG